MVTIAIIPYWGDSFIVLHTFLYIIFCTDAVAHQHNSERCALDSTLRFGKNLPVWRADNSRSRGIQTAEVKSQRSKVKSQR